MAKWVKNSTTKHVCAAPEVTGDVETGDEWLCDCGRLYVVFYVSWYTGRVEEFTSVSRSTETHPAVKTVLSEG